MKGVGIRKVYYTDNKQNIICENVKDMISINASSVTKMIDCLRMDLKMSHDDFFENLLKTLFPNKIKKINFEYFIEHDFSNVLPKHSYTMTKDLVVFYDLANKELVKSELI
jgi:hypothetical protein